MEASYQTVQQNIHTKETLRLAKEAAKDFWQMADNYCTCKVISGSKCGIGCDNRSSIFQCPFDCGPECTNSVIRRGDWSCKLVKKKNSKGEGLYTMSPVSEGAIIMEYVGEVIKKEVHNLRLQTAYLHDEHFYGLSLTNRLVIDSARVGNLSRFINHSCEPNCKVD